jgi:hypothetical protein
MACGAIYLVVPNAWLLTEGDLEEGPGIMERHAFHIFEAFVLWYQVYGGRGAVESLCALIILALIYALAEFASHLLGVRSPPPPPPPERNRMERARLEENARSLLIAETLLDGFVEAFKSYRSRGGGTMRASYYTACPVCMLDSEMRITRFDKGMHIGDHNFHSRCVPRLIAPFLWERFALLCEGGFLPADVVGVILSFLGSLCVTPFIIRVEKRPTIHMDVTLSRCAEKRKCRPSLNPQRYVGGGCS